MGCKEGSLIPHKSATSRQLQRDLVFDRCCEVDHREFREAMNVGTSDGPNFTELQSVIDLSKAWGLKERLIVGRLCLLSVAIHGIHHGSKIPLSSARRVLDPVGFERYPWGRVAFESLINSVKIVDYDKDSYVIQRCVHALVIWIYESVPGLGEIYGMKRDILTCIPLLDWNSSRKSIKLKDFIKKEKAEHGHVRVRHMIPVSQDNMYPTWRDVEQNAKKDPLLDNLIIDIINDRLPLNAWEGGQAVVVANKKRRVEVKDDLDISTMRNKKKKKVTEFIEEKDEEISKKKKDTLKEDLEKRSVLDVQLSNRIEEVEKDLKEMKESKPDAATSRNDEDDEANSRAPFWIVEDSLDKNRYLNL
ncbi:unnamed protein product [Arabidopsis thaliana]|uniref:DUF1985 domain-containing protein n=1 Tax=Arabidopsis thaliana TaxID=3702 RepID=A0A5S9XHF4_ARATH|nr:unnamed protein product [Arabidopsis thaliana]